jgi:hypothetical protein
VPFQSAQEARTGQAIEIDEKLRPTRTGALSRRRPVRRDIGAHRPEAVPGKLGLPGTGKQEIEEQPRRCRMARIARDEGDARGDDGIVARKTTPILGSRRARSSA